MEGLGATAGFSRPTGRHAATVLIPLSAVTLAAWLLTGERMAGMDNGPGTDLGSLGFFTTAWVVMMAAMMFPSVWPALVAHSRIPSDRPERSQGAPVGTTAAFAAGYITAWTAAGLVAYASLESLRSMSVDAFAWDRGGPYIAGCVILLAAIYQLTPLKEVCLSRCRNPMMFVIGSWRPGRLGAMRMGLEHGSWCLGCCWALMATLFAVGVMSVGWMALIAALIAVEKLLPWRRVASLAIAGALVALAIAVATAPASVPGLTLPGSGPSMDSMGAMTQGR